MADDDSVSTTVSLPVWRKEEWKEAAAEEDLHYSEWVRMMVAAGRREIAALEPEDDGAEQMSIRQAVLKHLPKERNEAIETDELIESVLDPKRKEIYDLLDNDEQIQYSSRYGGYYKDE